MNTQVLIRRPSLRDKNIIPPLENGDHLTQQEFHRRYEAMPENVKAELINGVVYMGSPVRVRNHGKPHSLVMSCFGIYFLSTNGVMLLDNTTLIVSDKHEPQPDIILRIEEKKGGRSRVNDKDYLEGAPELIVEIASSTASYDLYDKLEMYQQKGVQEYIVWRVLDERIDWFSLEGGTYQRLAASKLGIIESKVFPGLRMNTKAILEDDLDVVLSDLQVGLRSKKHREFVSKLAE